MGGFGRVLLVMPEQWPRALLRAELIERGCDAVGVETLDAALLCAPDDPERGPVGVLLIDQNALDEPSGRLVELIASRLGHPKRLLLTTPSLEEPMGAWDEIIKRPVHVGDLATVIQHWAPGA